MSSVLRVRSAAHHAVSVGPHRVLELSAKAHVLSDVSQRARQHTQLKHGENSLLAQVSVQVHLVRMQRAHVTRDQARARGRLRVSHV